MNKDKTSDLVPFEDAEGTKNIKIQKICVKVYLNQKEFLDVIKEAEKAGTRPRGLKPFRHKPHGFSDQYISNTKGLVKFIKNILLPAWKNGEAERQIQEKALMAAAEKLGMKIEKKG